MFSRISSIGLVCAIAVVSTAQDAVHDRIRGQKRNNIPKVSESQAADLTLTLAETSVRPIQVWVRTAGTIDSTKKVLSAYLSSPAADLVKVGQRVRSFPPDSKSSMYQAYVTRVAPQRDRTLVEATLSANSRLDSPYYVMEIVVDRGQFLSIPNEAIIEEGSKHIVYVPGSQQGQYLPREVRTGIQGELYTQVLDGLREGEQVVTFGSFFIDAEFKLKGSGEPPPAADMSGMDHSGMSGKSAPDDQHAH